MLSYYNLLNIKYQIPTDETEKNYINISINEIENDVTKS